MLVIGIAGGSGSGKTTVVNEITKKLKERVVVIPQDSYYKDSSDVPMEERLKINYDHPDAIDFDLPDNIDEMISLAEDLSVGIPHVRVDFLVNDKRIFFSEFTFYHCGGFFPFSPA